MKDLAVLTSGGDAPGMNACIRAVVRTAREKGIRAHGVMRGYDGLLEGDIVELKAADVSHIMHHGGTVLKSSRSKEFLEKEGRQKAQRSLKDRGIEGLITIGGNGTFRGAKALSEELPDLQVVGVPGTIDNDLYGTDRTIGYDTALNTVVEAVDKIRDTAASHDRLFFIEVMGRDAGFIALRSGIAVGADAILIPESRTDLKTLADKLRSKWEDHQASSIIVVAEGDELGGAYQVAERVGSHFPEYDSRVSVLGHMQRGGNPSAMDRVLASHFGNAAVEALQSHLSDVMIGSEARDMTHIPLDKAVKHHQKIREDLIRLAETLSI
ncbi:MAG: 6-phosphofructokinase [Flavobacteriales bacterium]